MEIQKKKCTSKEHRKIDAIIYCNECKIYMCNKCETFHSTLFDNHQTFNLEKNGDAIIMGFCTEKEHNNNKLVFFCKTHNQLCCAVCLCKIKKNEIGKHKDCDVCNIEDIKDEKINKLKTNMKTLDELSHNLQESIKNLRKIYDKINENKEELKLNIQKIFTKIRNELNNREDKLLLEVEKHFDDVFFKEEFIKESEKLPNKIKISLERGKNLDKEYKDDKLNLLINECINIENNITEIKNINNNINKYNELKKLNITFSPMKEEDMTNFLDNIKTFGKVDKYSNTIFEQNSLICTEYKKIKFMIEFVRMIKPNCKLKLIYRASTDGQMGKDFHSKCDNKAPTITFFKTKSNKKFGGYTESNWRIDDYGEDKNAYIFSINKEKYYKANKQTQYSIYSKNSRGPNFDGLWLKEPFFQDGAFWETIGDSQCFPKISECEFSDNENNITLVELEVFQII